MFVITADQIDSTNDIDRTGQQVADINAEFSDALVLPADQNSGDELQAIVADADAALGIILALNRTQRWSVGVGVGNIRAPLPDATRKAAGDAFIAARQAVTAAKRAASRFALAVGGTGSPEAVHPTAGDVEALIAVLLLLRDRRTDQGWQVVELLSGGLTQREAAEAIGITSQAVSMRVKAAHWRAEQAAIPPLVRLLSELDGRSERPQ